MSIKKFAVTAALAAVAVFGTTAASFADTYYASRGVNVRSGPGTSYYKIGSLYAGQKVDRDYCRGSWCFISWDGYEGWVAKRYLVEYYEDNYKSGGGKGGY